MNELAYFPGCSLKETAKAFETSAIAVMDALGLPLVELKRWNCCGTVFSLTTDDLMHHIASVRNLIRAQETGATELVTLCSMCFNTLKRVSQAVSADKEALTKINAFMNEEVDYAGKVEVKHLLEILRDRIGWEKISERVMQSLEGLIVAPYYGCTLVRPSEAGIDDAETPTVMQELIKSVGATAQTFPFQTECCGSYLRVDRRDLVVERGYRILSAARRTRADLIVTACPLCQHNLEQTLGELGRTLPEEEPIPILYFTQLLAIAFCVEAGPLPLKLTKKLTILQGAIEGGN
jgi:heterodisulfide reductase subunit B